MVIERAVQVQDAEVRLREYLTWQLFITGAYYSYDVKGVLIDQRIFTQTTFVATVPWSTVATATPYADMLSMQLTKSRGFSIVIDATTPVYTNRKWANYVRLNANANDIFGRRLAVGSTFNSLEDVNKLYTMNGVPYLKTYDKGYRDTTGTFQPYISDNAGVVVARREDGAAIGEWCMTRNWNNGGAPGMYMRTIDTMDRQVPRSIQVHRGFNGGINVFYPEAIPFMSI